MQIRFSKQNNIWRHRLMKMTYKMTFQLDSRHTCRGGPININAWKWLFAWAYVQIVINHVFTTRVKTTTIAALAAMLSFRTILDSQYHHHHRADVSCQKWLISSFSAPFRIINKSNRAIINKLKRFVVTFRRESVRAGAKTTNFPLYLIPFGLSIGSSERTWRREATHRITIKNISPAVVYHVTFASILCSLAPSILP